MNQQEVKEEVNHYWFSLEVEFEVEECPPLIVTRIVMAESVELAENMFWDELDEVTESLCFNTTGIVRQHHQWGINVNDLYLGGHFGEFELEDKVIKEGE